MGSTSKIVFGSVLIISITAMFLIFSMQKRAQLALDKEGLEHSVQLKSQEIEAVQSEMAAVKAENAVIPELRSSLETAHNEKQGHVQQIEKLQGELERTAQLEEEHAMQKQQLAEEHARQQQLLADAEQAQSSAAVQAAEDADRLTALQEKAGRQKEQLSQTLADLEQKDRVIQILKGKVDKSAENVTFLKTSNSNDRLNLTLVLDELAMQSAMIDGLRERIVQLGGSSDFVPSEVETDIAKQRAAKANDQALIEKLTLENDSLQTIVDGQADRIKELGLEIQDSAALLVVKTAELDERQQAGGAIQEELEQLRLSVSSKDQQITELQAGLADKETNLENAKAEAVASTGSMTEQITALEEEIAEATANNLSLTQTNSRNEDSLAALLQKNDELAAELALSKSTLDEAQLEITGLTESLQAAEESLQQESASQQALTSEFEPVKAALSESEEKYNSLNSQYLTMEEELSSAQTALDAARVELTQTLAAGTSLKEELEALSATVVEKDGNIEDLSGQLDATREQIAEMEAAAGTSLKDEFEALSATVTEKDESIEDLSGQLDATRERIAEMEAAAGEESSKQQLSQEEMAEQEQRIAKLIEEVAAAKAVSESQTSSLKVQEEELASLKAQSAGAASLEADNRELAASLTQLQDELKKNEELISGLKDSMTSLEQERDHLLLYTRDTDNDGISDAEDKCPDTVEGTKVNAQGCEEDSDQDGLVNRLDLCPDTESGSAANALGCSDAQSTVVLKGIKFQLGTSKLTPDAQSALHHAAAILQSNPDVQMEVAGHTDSIGEPQGNLRLSTNRAKSVLNYLTSQGVAEAQLQAKGYGSENPIGDNATESGRAQNRRVELRRIDATPTEAGPEAAVESTDQAETVE